MVKNIKMFLLFRLTFYIFIHFLYHFLFLTVLPFNRFCTVKFLIDIIKFLIDFLIFTKNVANTISRTCDV